MFSFITHYALTLLSAAVTLAVGVVLLMLSIPYTKEWQSFRQLRGFLAATCLLLTAANVASCMTQQEAEDPAILSLATLVMASYQALLFTAAALVFVHSPRIHGRVAFQSVCITLAGVLLTVSQAFLPAVFPFLFWMAVAAYVVQITYYTAVFRKEFCRCVARLEVYYDDAMSGRMRWIQRFFYCALAVGILALLASAVPLPLPFYGIFIVVFTAFYVYVCGCVVSYRTYAEFIVRMAVDREARQQAAQSGANEEELQLTEEKEQELQRAIREWIEKKGFTKKDTTLDDIARQLGTSQRLLAAHFNKYARVSFRSWRTKLRIDEACRLLREEDNLMLKSLNELVGIGDYSYFYKQFKLSTGMSPSDYRERFYHTTPQAARKTSA